MSDKKKTTEIRRPLLANGERLKHAATRVRGSRDKFHPVTVQEAFKVLEPQARALTANMAALPSDAVGRHVVFEATLQPNYLAPSHYPAEVLDASGLYMVGTRPARGNKVTKTRVQENQATKTLLVAGTPNDVKRFADRITAPPNSQNEKEWDELRRFTAVSLPQAESVIVRRPSVDTAGASMTFEAVITHVFDNAENHSSWADEHFSRFVRMVYARGGVVDAEYRRDLGGLTFVPVLVPLNALDGIAQFNLLRALRPMPEFAPFPDEVMRVAQLTPSVSRASRAGERPSGVVAVFDGGVNPNLSVFSPFVTAFDLTSEAAVPVAMRHGSMVTSALLYGPVIGGAGQLLDPTTNVDHYRVFPFPPPTPGKPDHRLYEMLDKMTAVLRNTPYSIVVLATGPNDSLDEAAEPDRFTAELDALAFERDITFITAVGNNGEADSLLGYDRVQPPGDMVNGIGVGAITKNARDPKKRWARAPYSAKGPGREGQRVQPLVVEFGGSDEERFVGFDERGRLVSNMGTSFASPTVGRAVGGLRGALEPARHRPDVLRAFTVHHAERGHGHGKKFIDLGYGRVPAAFEHIFECAPNEVTVLYEDSLARGDVTALRFPFPNGLPAGASLELTWTISYVSEVDPRDASDYTLSGIESVFRPDSRRHSLTDAITKKSEIVRIDVDRARITASLAAGGRLSEEPAAHSQWMLTKGEQRLRRDGKWETIMPGRTLMKAADLFEPRLDVLHLRRTDGRLVRGAAIEPLRFAMLLTIRATSGEPIYDLVAAQYRVLTPLVRVPVRLSSVI